MSREHRLQLVKILDTTEEAPVYVHPNMGKRYAEAVDDLLGSLNSPDHRHKSSEIIRSLVDKIVLTPNAEKTELVVDLYGDLAGILQVSEAAFGAQAMRDADKLEKRERKEIEQIKSLMDSPGTVSEPGFAPSKGKMVAGACNRLDLPSGKTCKGKLVAGAGFEPATFRL